MKYYAFLASFDESVEHDLVKFLIVGQILIPVLG